MARRRCATGVDAGDLAPKDAAAIERFARFLKDAGAPPPREVPLERRLLLELTGLADVDEAGQ